MKWCLPLQGVSLLYQVLDASQGHNFPYITCLCVLSCAFYLPYSGKFSSGKNFAKPRCVVLWENFARFIFAHMRLGEIKFHGIINDYSFKRGSLAVSSSLEKCLAAAESPFSLAIWTSVNYLASYKALSSPL